MSIKMAAKLQEWACNVFDYRTSVDIDPEEEFDGLTRMSSLCDIWSYVIDYAKPLPVVMQAREQLKKKRMNFKDIQTDDDRNLKDLSRLNILLNEKSRNIEAIKESNAKLNRLHEDVDRVNAVRCYTMACSEMMRNNCADISMTSQKIEQYITSLRKESRSSNADQFYSRKKIDDNLAMSTECMKTSSDHYNSVYDKLIEVIDESPKMNHLNNFKLTFNKTNELFAFKDVMSSLSTLIDERLEFLQKKLNDLNVGNDLERLQLQKDPNIVFKYNNETVKLKGKATSLMTAGKLKVIDKLIESDEIIKQRLDIAEENKSALDSIAKRRDSLVISQFIDSECNLNAINGQLKLLTDVSTEFESDLKKMLPNQKYLKYGFDKIRSFNKQKEQNEAAVCSLMQRNFILLKNLDAHLATIEIVKKQKINDCLSLLKKMSLMSVKNSEVASLGCLLESAVGVTRLNNKYVLTSTLSINRNRLESNMYVDYGENRLLTDKAFEDVMLEFRDALLRKTELETLSAQFKKYKDLNVSPSEIKDLEINLKSNYKKKLASFRSAFSREIENYQTWKLANEVLKNSIDLWFKNRDGRLQTLVDNLNDNESMTGELFP